MPKIDLKGKYPEDLWTVLGCMYFPSDPKMREASYARQFVGNGGNFDDISIDALDLPDRKRVRDAATSASKKGYIVGTILYFLYEMDRHKFEETSLTKAKALTKSNLSDTVQYGDGKWISLSDRTLANYWSEFSASAHLWASYVLNQHFPHIPHNEIFTEQYLDQFLGLATTMQNFVTSFTSPRKSGEFGLPLTINDIWSIPKEIPQLIPAKIEMPDIFFEMASKKKL